MEDDVVYVAVGRKVEESKLTLLWALRYLRIRKLCILHVHIPLNTICSNNESEDVEKALGDIELSDIHECLNDYIGICHQEGVDPGDIETSCMGMFGMDEGIVEIIYRKNVKELVMGAAADDLYSEGMTDLISGKAKYVVEHAPHSCRIWFVCNGFLIREESGKFDRFDDGGSSLAFDDCTSGSRESETTAAPMPLERTEEIEDDLVADQPNMQEITGDDQLHGKVEQLIAEAEKAKRDAFDETIKRLKAEKDFLGALRKSREFETLLNEERRLRNESEEALAKGREQLDKTSQERDEARGMLAEACQKRRESEEALAREIEKNKKANKEIEEMRQRALDDQVHIAMYKKERDEILEQRNEAVEILKAVTEESSGQQPHSVLPPSYFLCPISQEIMVEPHIAADGHTYEAAALRNWFNSGHDTSPMTNLRLLHRNLVPNRALRSAIQEWLEQHPGFHEST